MKIGIAVFAYNRSWHLQQVLNGLQKNDNVDKLYIFQDGLKCEEHKSEWKKVRNIINNITWCKRYSYFSDYNQGLARSITEGTDLVLQDNDAVIVLEDDCVPTANFISFMSQCLEKYEKDKDIYSVSGYSWPIQLNKQKYDVYGCGRISSWGWGTWKDKWGIYEKDYELIKELKGNAITSLNLATWGQDLEETLVENVRGNFDSWAVFWALNVISKQGICINPYQSFIKNIGMDGTGVHCDITEQYNVECIDENKEVFCLPDKITILNETKSAFASLHGSYTAINNGADNKKRIVVYGVGNFYLRNEKEINEEYFIEAFVDKNKKGFFAGKKIIKPNAIVDYDFEKMVIMLQDENECISIAQTMIKSFAILENKIEFGFLKYKN